MKKKCPACGSRRCSGFMRDEQVRVEFARQMLAELDADRPWTEQMHRIARLDAA